MINEKAKQGVTVLICLFIFSFFLINWGNVSWIFNYQVVSSLTHDFFNPYPDSQLLVSASEIQLPSKPQHVAENLPDIAAIPAATAAQTPTPTPRPQPVNHPSSDKENSLEIPGIGLVSPLIIAKSTNNLSLKKDLDKGVVYYPGSVLPGEQGHIVILGHSAPPNWPKIKHDWVFSEINSLNAGDSIVLYFNNKQYTYLVTKKNIIQKGQELTYDESNKNILTIVSCWPPGKDYQRIAVQAELSIN